MTFRYFRVGVLAILAFFAVVWFAHRALTNGEQELMEHKSARTTTGIVTGRNLVMFGPTQTAYVNDEGKTMVIEPWRKKSGEYRIFYKIRSFDEIPEPYRTQVTEAEKHRLERFGDRFRIVDKHAYDELLTGTKLTIRYRWAGDGNIEIISVDSEEKSSG